MTEKYLIYQDDRSNKFWNIETNGKNLTTYWGRIGTMGQSQTKSFYTEDGCEREAKKLIKSKVKKGYVEAVTEDIIMETFIMILSGVAKYRSPNEVYYRNDKFNKMATIEFIDGSSDNLILRHYYENGNKKSEHELTNGKQNGNDFGWYEDGTKHWERKFSNGKLVYEQRY